MKKRQIIIFATLVAIVAGASVAAAFLLGQYESRQKTSGPTPTQPHRLPAEDTAYKADKIAREGDVAGGVEVLDKAIAQADDNHEKFIYYSRKAMLLYNHGQLDAALEPAKKALELEPSSTSAAFVGQIYRESGNNQAAIDFYKEAIELIDETDPLSDEDKARYESIIKDLEAAR